MAHFPRNDAVDVRTIGASSFAGQERDIVVRWNVARRIAGEYLRDSGPSDGADFAYAQTVFAF